jgi:hypothetical protein
MGLSPLYCGHWLAYCTCPGWLWWWRIWWNEDWQGKPKYSEKTCPSATLSTTNPAWPDPGSNPGRRGGKPATNRLSYGAAPTVPYPCDTRNAVLASHCAHAMECKSSIQLTSFRPAITIQSNINATFIQRFRRQQHATWSSRFISWIQAHF